MARRKRKRRYRVHELYIATRNRDGYNKWYHDAWAQSPRVWVQYADWWGELEGDELAVRTYRKYKQSHRMELAAAERVRYWEHKATANAATC